MHEYSLLKTRIHELGYTQGDIARMMGMTQGTISMKLNGKWDWKLWEVKELKRILKLTDEEVLKVFIYG